MIIHQLFEPASRQTQVADEDSRATLSAGPARHEKRVA